MPGTSQSDNDQRHTDSWSAMITRQQANLAMLPGLGAFPDHATTWADYAARTFEELLIEDLCWFHEPNTGIMGFRPYVKGTDQWGGADRTREITELMSTMDVLWPMYRYLQLHPNRERQNLVDAFIDELPKYYNPEIRQAPNRPSDVRHDSWYFMENAVLKTGHLYQISEINALDGPYFGSLESALDMAHNFDYLFPQFISLEKDAAAGYNTLNHSTAGLLAYSLIHAYQITGQTRYLVEAENALLAMRRVEDPFFLLYEPQELAAATAAAAHMHHYAREIGSETDFVALANGFFYVQARMIYYNEGQIDLPGFQPQLSQWLPDSWRDGLHVPYYNPVEKGGINAPAFKENVEAVMFWADYVRLMRGAPGFDPTTVLKILNLNRIKNFYFFSPNIPNQWEREYGPGSLQYIPYEDVDYYAVRDHEDESTRFLAGYNGKEIYGAGEVLWSYLLFEALGEAEDHNALIVNLNLFDPSYPPNAGGRVYLVFNPYPEARSLAFRLHNLAEPITVLADGLQLQTVDADGWFTVDLPAEGYRYITVSGDD